MTKKLLAVIFIFGIARGSLAQENNPVLKDVNARKLQKVIASYEGKKAVLVNVWATWCIPCVEEFPAIVKIQQKYPEQLQVVFVSVDFPENRGRVISFLKKHKVDWTTYLSTKQSATFIESLSADWSGVVPFTKILNKKGKVIFTHENKLSFDALNQQVKRALNL
jgi:thiol-disulfide isomerase/thioredoxin